jgi:hypothetical protein
MADYSLYPTDEEVPAGPGILLKKARARLTSAGDTLTNNVAPGQGSVLPNSIDMLRNRSAETYKRASDLMNAPLDYSGIQDFAKQRSQQGDAAMMNALAAQFAGEQFAPVQEQLLKKSAGAREPIKMGGGLITPEGQFIKDPEAAQDKEVNMLLQNAKAYEQIAQTAESSRERIAAQRRHDEIMENIALGNQNLRRDLAANKQPDYSKTWRAEDNLRGDFDKLTKDLREELNATSKITQIVGATPPGQKPDAITQQSLVILLNKFLDPGSVVREGEFDRVVKAQGLEGQARNLYDRIIKGQPLDAATIQQINGLANLYSQAATAKIQSIADNYTDIAGKRNLDLGSVISDPRFRRAPGAGSNSNAPLSAAEQAELQNLRQRFGKGGG